LLLYVPEALRPNYDQILRYLVSVYLENFVGVSLIVSFVVSFIAYRRSENLEADIRQNRADRVTSPFNSSLFEFNENAVRTKINETIVISAFAFGIFILAVAIFVLTLFGVESKL
jgi:hypothetical protein